MVGTTSGSAQLGFGAALAALAVVIGTMGVERAAAQEALPNACPVDGCEVKIAEVKRAGDELEVKFEANFTPDFSKNHIHVWWGDNFTVQQVSNNAETVHNVKQGEWHPTADYPSYTTQSAVSLAVRGSSTHVCVSAADRNHDILDIKLLHCVDVGSQL